MPSIPFHALIFRFITNLLGFADRTGTVAKDMKNATDVLLAEWRFQTQVRRDKVAARKRIKELTSLHKVKILELYDRQLRRLKNKLKNPRNIIDGSKYSDDYDYNYDDYDAASATDPKNETISNTKSIT